MVASPVCKALISTLTSRIISRVLAEAKSGLLLTTEYLSLPEVIVTLAFWPVALAVNNVIDEIKSKYIIFFIVLLLNYTLFAIDDVDARRQGVQVGGIVSNLYAVDVVNGSII